MVNMNTIGIHHHLNINLDQKVLKLHNNIPITGIFINNIGIQSQIRINGEENK